MSKSERPRVLLVDDDPVMRMLAVAALDAESFEVLECADGEEAVANFESLRPDLVLLDVQMPGVDGYQTCQALRQTARGASTPIMMITGREDVDSIRKAYNAGATDFLTKPINYALLPYRLQYMLRSAAALVAVDKSAHDLRRAQKQARLAQWERDLDTGTLRCSPDSLLALGVESDDPQLSIPDMVHVEDVSRVSLALNTASAHRIDFRLVLPDGRERVVHQQAELEIDSETGHRRLVGTTQDVTELRRAERQIVELAYADTLTGLPNRAFLQQYMTRALADAERSRRPLAVLALDLDSFKRVNDTLGHAAGDALLREVAQRVTACTRGSDVVARFDAASIEQALTADTVAARLGGDEFVIVLTSIRRPEDAGVVAQRIADKLATGFVIGGSEVFVSSSIGIATYPADGTNAEQLLECADTAMYHAKSSGRNGFRFFTTKIHDQAKRRMQLENSLRLALSRAGIVGTSNRRDAEICSEFELYYQPKVEMPHGAVLGAEALLRWRSPERGFVSPADFIPIAEDTGLIVPLGEWVLRTACRQAQIWATTAAFAKPLRVAVNVSARQFREPGFAQVVAATLEETGLSPDLLELEITESVLMEDTGASGDVLMALKSLGVRIALDDFGTGYSSLSHLSRLPIDALKIDRSFVHMLGGQGKNETIAAAIIALSRGLQIDVVVEGVETLEQLAFVQRHGRAEIQGFLFAKPMPVADVVGWVRHQETERPFTTERRIKFRPRGRASLVPAR
jgi:predicted signal transduction protein with EAL and GGDEF domain/DNA-binding response OmpR family regulator